MTRKERARLVLEALRRSIPEPQTELRYETPYQLLVAVVLSAQCTDERVNRVTPALFEAFPDAHRLAQAEPETVYPYIRSISYPNNKARHLVGAARRLVEQHDGDVPASLSDLQTLPGVGRKTAQVVASVAFGIDALPVDTHVFRVANRIGLARNAPAPLDVERQLKRHIPAADWGEAHHLLILHGRYTCTARTPRCADCPLTDFCDYYARLQRLPPPVDDLDSKRARYACRTCGLYFDTPASHVDRYGTDQVACPRCGSMTVYDTRTGKTTKKVRDYRIG